MDRDGWLKTIDNFIQLSGASEGNPQLIFFNSHDSHCDPDVYVHAMFLKAGDSENDQPNDNNPNTCFNACYNNQKNFGMRSMAH